MAEAVPFAKKLRTVARRGPSDRLGSEPWTVRAWWKDASPGRRVMGVGVKARRCKGERAAGDGQKTRGKQQVGM